MLSTGILGDAGRLVLGFGERLGAEEKTVADAGQQIGLSRFEGDQPAEHVQEVDQVGGVFREPALGLDLVERRGRAATADDRALRSRRR